MRFDHDFVVPVPVADAWSLLLDVERVAPCVPGATVHSRTGDEFSGEVRVKVGPMSMSYRGTATIVARDEATRTLVIEGSGRESRGSGTAGVKVSAQLRPADTGTRVLVRAELDVTGRPAQFGRDVLAGVSERLVAQFADRLADQLAESAADESPARPSGASPADRPSDEALDLLGLVATPLSKRALVGVGVVAFAGLLVVVLRARRSARE